jgi:hypothetical protein
VSRFAGTRSLQSCAAADPILAAAGDWDAVAGYQCTGINSYAKMVRQYRDRLVTAHRAQQAAATEQGAAQ